MTVTTENANFKNFLGPLRLLWLVGRTDLWCFLTTFSGTGGRMALGYGLTESAGVGTHNWGELLETHPNSVGRVFPGIEMSIRDANNQPLPNGAQGEICIR